jgi:hypothetical protein
MKSPNPTVRSLSRPFQVATSLVITWFFGSLSMVTPSAAQEAPPITIESILVEPSSPGPDTLCKLTVKLANGGDRTASQLDFKVQINGEDLPVYANQLFMFPVPAGESVDVPLYNFWSTETSRPLPGDGKLDIEVTLAAAQWMEIKLEEDVEVWRPLGPVEGLPTSKSVPVSMSK